MPYYVYILASKRNGTLYIGVTNDITRRITEHKTTSLNYFTNKYKIHILVYFEIFNDLQQAREKEWRMKKWKREWKITIIEKVNPSWKDLYYSLTQ